MPQHFLFTHLYENSPLASLLHFDSPSSVNSSHKKVLFTRFLCFYTELIAAKQVKAIA